MSAHVLLIFKELGKRENMRGLPSILSLCFATSFASVKNKYLFFILEKKLKLICIRRTLFFVKNDIFHPKFYFFTFLATLILLNPQM